MSRRTFTILLLALFAIKSVAQQVEQVQRSLLTKRTASWCPNCGAWGWTFFHNLIDDNKDKAVFFAAHYDGILETQVANEITTNFGGSYQPIFFMNHVNVNATSSNAANTRVSVKNAVEASFAAAPLANVGFSPYYTGGEIRVNAKAKFFQAAQGEFYLGIYLVENNVRAYQASIGSNANHQKVLRYSFTPSSWGELLVNGNISPGEEFQKTFSLPIGDPSGYSYEVAGVIWKKVGAKYEVVNAWATSQFSTPNAISSIQSVKSFEVNPSVTNSTAAITLDLSEGLPIVTLEMLDLSGKKVLNVFNGSLTPGLHSFTVNCENLVANGIYVLRLTDGENISTQKIIYLK